MGSVNEDAKQEQQWRRQVVDERSTLVSSSSGLP
jgi:hypothetical protein